MQPSDSVHHETISEVSLYLRLRSRIAAVVCMIKNVARRQLEGRRSSSPNFIHIQGESCRRNNFVMPEEETVERAREDEREGLSPSTQAGEFVREKMEPMREGKRGARAPEQAIAMGLSRARRAGVKLPPPKRGKTSTKRQAKRDLTKGRTARRRKPSAKRSRATKRALKRESHRSASR